MKSQQLQLLLTEFQRKKLLFNAYDESERIELAQLRTRIAKLRSELSN